MSLTLYTIFRAVQWESFFWGLGTALGELPPYFVARAGNATLHFFQRFGGDCNQKIALYLN